MNIQPTDTKVQALSDDQELAKVLAGVNGDTPDDEAAAATDASGAPALPPLSDAAADGTMPDPLATAEAEPAAEAAPEAPTAEPDLQLPELPAMPDVPAPDSDLETIKKEALGELRPLVDKLNVSPEEKFDTYLLLLRSTDDRELIAPAHEAAKSIADEARKAQALLDIIKEIDFLSNPQQPAAK